MGEPWRLAEGALRDWKVPLDLTKNGHSVGKIIISVAVYDHMVALLKPAAEARAEPNQNPQLPEPLRRLGLGLGVGVGVGVGAGLGLGVGIRA